MPPPLTSTSHALLGLLAIQPWSTYELAKQVERSLRCFWPRAERKVYNEAKRLVGGGYANTTDESTGALPPTVYRITPKGRNGLAAWLGEPSVPPKLESEALERVFFADAASLAVLRQTFKSTWAHPYVSSFPDASRRTSHVAHRTWRQPSHHPAWQQTDPPRPAAL